VTLPDPGAVAFVQFHAGGGGGQVRFAGPPSPLPIADGGGGQQGRSAEAFVAFLGGGGGQQATGPRGPGVLTPEARAELFVAPVPFVGGGPQQIGPGKR
jgi:hypothetical protein